MPGLQEFFPPRQAEQRYRTDPSPAPAQKPADTSELRGYCGHAGLSDKSIESVVRYFLTTLFIIAFSMTKPPVLPGVGKKTLAKEKVKNRSFFKGKRMVRRF